MKKVIYIDTETTGLHPPMAELFQLAFILEIDGTVVFEKDYRCCPSRSALERLDPKAVEAHGITADIMRQYPPGDDVQKMVVSDLSKLIDKYDKKDKATPCAYNGHFDLSFLRAWFELHGDKYMGSFISKNLIDPLAIIRWLHAENLFPDVGNHQLSTVCERLKIPLKAHDALADVRALRDLWRIVRKAMRLEVIFEDIEPQVDEKDLAAFFSSFKPIAYPFSVPGAQ